MRYSARRLTARIRIAAATGAALAAAVTGLVASPAVAAQVRAASTVPAANTVPAARPVPARPKTILLLNGDRMIIDGKSTDFELAGRGFAAAVTERCPA